MPPSSGTSKFELGTHLSHRDLEINRVAAHPGKKFSYAEGAGLDDLSNLDTILVFCSPFFCLLNMPVVRGSQLVLLLVYTEAVFLRGQLGSI